MEIVLQWLDDLDDLVFATLFSWRSICRCALAPGILSAVILTPFHSVDLGLASVALLSALAAGSVLAWVAAALITICRSVPQTLATA